MFVAKIPSPQEDEMVCRGNRREQRRFIKRVRLTWKKQEETVDFYQTADTTLPVGAC